MSTNTVETAQQWASWLLKNESRGPGDTVSAMRRIERKHGISYSLLWALRYRPPQDLWASAFLKLGAAYEAERTRQMRLLQNEIENTDARNKLVACLVRAAAATGGVDSELVKQENLE